MASRGSANGKLIALVVVASGMAQVESLLLRTNRTTETSTESCVDMVTKGSHFTVLTSVGTPPQNFEIVADTGSPGLIVRDCSCKGGSSHDCFEGPKKSSTYQGPVGYWKTKVMEHKFVSGSITTSPSSDVVQIGTLRATMKSGLLLMIESHVWVPEFEGILGLGLPPDHGRFAHDHMATQSFSDAAGAKFFSICLSHGPNTLRFNPSPATTMLKQVGKTHWGLELHGLSMGSANADASVCSLSSAPAGHSSACAIIPDSGTTNIMAPQNLIDEIYTDVCRQWPRCAEAAAGGSSLLMQFNSLMSSCGLFDLDEVPSIFLHLAGSDGSKHALELSSWAWITKYGSQCNPAFTHFVYNGGSHGAVFVLGQPLFYQYQVIFGLDPLSIGFSDQPCQSCSQSPSVNFAASTQSLKGGQRFGRVPRAPIENPRLPSIDTSQPF